jgi:UDP-N-acetylmuramate dehydrogenase
MSYSFLARATLQGVWMTWTLSMTELVHRTVRLNEPMGPHTTYRVGGRVRTYVDVTTQQGLAESIDQWSSDDTVRVVGNGSNLLVADGDHDISVLHLRDELTQITWEFDGDEVVVVAGAGLDLPVASRKLAAAGVRGFEWAVGVPGTFGGAIAMNAGGHGADMAASVEKVWLWRDGVRREVAASELCFGYRHSALSAGDVVESVQLRLHRGEVDEAKQEISSIVSWRREHQPGGANAGSVFRNPEGDSAGRLLEAAGLKGLRLGTAQISTKHANFIIADANGSANDVFNLMRVARDRVLATSGVTLIAETRLWGFGEAL